MKKIAEIIGCILRNIEVLLCLRKTPYKTSTMPCIWKRSNFAERLNF